MNISLSQILTLLLLESIKKPHGQGNGKTNSPVSTAQPQTANDTTEYNNESSESQSDCSNIEEDLLQCMIDVADLCAQCGIIAYSREFECHSGHNDGVIYSVTVNRLQ